MNDNKLVVAAAPHITSNESTRKLMLAVVFALCPTLVASTVIFGPRVLLLVGVTTAACVGFEFLYTVMMKKPMSIGDFSAVVTGLILAFNLPPNFPLWMAVIGAFVAIVITKMLFGGIGYNFANPALVGRIVLQLSFTGPMIQYTAPITAADAVAGATPLAAGVQSVPLMDLLLGTHTGVLGETCAITLLLGGIALIILKVISPAIPLVYLGGTFVLKFLLEFGATAQDGGFGAAVSGMGSNAYGTLLYLLGGGLLLGAFFMATDYATSPYTLKGKVVFGIGLAVLTVAMREWARTPESVSYALLIMNLLVPYINTLFRQKPMGTGRHARKAQKRQKGVA